MEDVNWIHLAQCRNQLRNFVNMVMNFGFYIKFVEFFEWQSDCSLSPCLLDTTP
jgi:hypothetical protein